MQKTQLATMDLTVRPVRFHLRVAVHCHERNFQGKHLTELAVFHHMQLK